MVEFLKPSPAGLRHTYRSLQKHFMLTGMGQRRGVATLILLAAGLALAAWCSGGAVADTDRRHLRELPSLRSPSGWALAQRAAQDQDHFCRGLSSHQLPPPLLDIPWLPPGEQPAPGQSGDGQGVWRRLSEAGQPGAGGAASLAAKNAQMAQHEADMYKLASQQGPGPLATLGSQPLPLRARAPEVAAPAPLGGSSSSSSTRLTLVQGIRSRLVNDGQFVLSAPFQMYVHANDDIVSGFISQHGSWEELETQQLVGALTALSKERGVPREDLIFMDVGANIGAHAIAAAAFGFPVLAFEPMHVNIMSLRHTLCANPDLQQRVTLVPTGLGSANQKCTIYSASFNIGDGSMLCGPADSPAGYPGLTPRGKLEVARLDDLMQPDALSYYTGKIGVVKIDVEGNELMVLEGGLRFFQTVRPAFVMAECNDAMMIKASSRPASAFLLKMHEIGYDVHQHSFNGPILTPAQLSQWKEPNIVNYWLTLR